MFPGNGGVDVLGESSLTNGQVVEAGLAPELPPVVDGAGVALLLWNASGLAGHAKKQT